MVKRVPWPSVYEMSTAPWSRWAVASTTSRPTPRPEVSVT